MATSLSLASAKQLLDRDAAAALRIAQAVSRQAPSLQAALLMAAALRRVGQPGRAVTLLAPIAQHQRGAWGVHFEHGLALGATGDTPGALAALALAVQLNPASLLARHALGDLRLLAGMPLLVDPADPMRDAALRDAALRDAVVALLDGANAALDRFGLGLNDAAALCLIADIGLNTGRPAAAAHWLQEAVRLAPGYAPARFRLAAALHRAERDAEALPLVETILAAHPTLRHARALRGAILIRLDRTDAALADLAVVANDPAGDAPGWLAYGHALRLVGQRAEAVAAYRRALAIEPTFGEAWWSIADLKVAVFTPDDVTAMEALIAHDDLSPLARSHVGFALGKVRADAGDVAAAFTHYATANAQRRALEPYDAAAQEAFVARAITTLDAPFFAERAGWGHADPAPIFVVGMPRSGSTLVEQILASHSQIEGLSELPDVTALGRGIAGYPEALRDLTPATAAALGAAYIARVRARRPIDRAHHVDKFPGNAFHVGLIHLMLPSARIIDVRRDARDCCVSLFTQSFAAGQAYSYDLGDLARHYTGYLRMMAHIDRVLPGRILRVEYEAVVDDLEAQARRILDHIGVAFEPACLRFFDNDRAVRTASSEQVRQPIYRGAIGRWRAFEPWISPLIEGLGVGAMDVIRLSQQKGIDQSHYDMR